ncbi:MAG TPA: HEAT repeat domain-containing protein [Fibrobacteria bacterium]|nr:HEAT repeat domain-containing protein [Fibrobacteria bacterium]
MNRTQALKELQLLENYEFDRSDAPGRLLTHLSSSDGEVVLAALRASTGYFGLPGIWERIFELAASAQDEETRAIANASLWPVMQDGSGWDWMPDEDEEIDPEIPMPPEPLVPREIYESTKAHLLAKVDAKMETMDVRRRCLEALGHIAFLPEVRTLVLRFYQEAPNILVRVSAIYAMGLVEDDEFERIVVEELDSTHPDLLSEAIHACANLRLEEVWSRVSELLDHPDEDVRFEALAATGMLVPLAESESTMEDLSARFRDARSRDALRIAAAALEERRLEESGEDEAWRMDQVRDEIDRMTDTNHDAQ